MLRNIFFLGGLFFAASFSLLAQPGGGGIDDSNVTIISSFEARLTDATRVQVTPVPMAADTNRRRLQYNVVDRPLNIDYPAPLIRPRGVGREKAAPTKNGYINIGAGLPGALYGDLSYDLSGVDNADLGIYARHHSFNNTSKIENQKSSDTEFGVEGSYLFDQGFAVSAGANYETQSRYYYGYNFPEGLSDTTELPSFTDDQVRQRFNTFGVHGEIFNGTRTAANIDYKAGIDLYLMDGDPAVRENGIDFRVEATKWIADDTPLDFKLRTDFTSYKDTSSQNLNNIYFSPSYTTPIAGKYRLKIGVNLTSQDDDFDIFPDVSLTAPIIDGLLSAFIGAEGSLQKNTLRSLSDYNPWVEPRLRIRNSEYTRIYGGVDGTISGIFDVIYDDANIVTLQATATAEPIEHLSVNATVAQRFYSLEDEEKPWHLPAFTKTVSPTGTVKATPRTSTRWRTLT